MLRLAHLSIRRPRAALLAWGSLTVLLSIIGLGVAHSLSPSIVVVSGTESSRAQQLATAHFGPTQLVPILLQGPAAQLDRQGPRLVRDLIKRPHTRALSAWDAGAASQGLRPSQSAAMIVVSVDRPEKDVVNQDQPQIERLVARDLASPVRASVTGQPSIDRALKDHALSDSLRAELIALAILFLLLLLALRTPLAAALVTLIGAGTVLSAFGLMALLGRVIDTDPIAVALASMTGLALGVGYALLILDRAHQQQRASTADPSSTAKAVTTAVETTGRAVLFAGTGLILALLLATAIAPTTILTSLGIGVLLCSALAVGGAVVVMPAAITLFKGAVLDTGHTAPDAITRDWDRLLATGAWVRHRAVIAGALATAALLALSLPALSLNTGPPDVSQLPAGDHARQSFEQVARVMGPGWPTPYNLIVVDPHGPITTAATLAKLDGLQQELARDPRVASVAGPGGLSAETKPLGTLPGQLKESSKLLVGGKSDLQRLVNGLGQAGSGAKQLQNGLKSATSGAGELHSGSGSAQSGSAQLHAGLAAARSGSAQLSDGLKQALSGAGALKNGATQALAGSIELTNGIGSAHAPVAAGLQPLKQLAGLTASTSEALKSLQGQAQGAAGDLTGALEALRGMSAGKSDPRYDAALAAAERAENDIGGLSSGLGGALPGAGSAAGIASTAAAQGSFLTRALQELHTGAAKLQGGLAKLRKGNLQLATGIGALSGGGTKLTGGLTQLRDGAGALEAGLGQLTSGAGQLESGLAGGVSPTGQLVNGLGVMQTSVAKFRRSLPSPKGLEELKQKSPGLFNSGYFLLAAIAGAPPASSNAAGFAVNVTRGGDAGQIVVISRYRANAAQTAALGEHLTAVARRFATRNRLELAVGGPAGNLANFASATNSRLPWVIVALALAIALTLGLALRAVLLPVLAVGFNLLTAAATFGAMTLLFGGSHPPLGGPGYLDPMSIIGIFTAIFGISLVFLVVLLARTRELLIAGESVDRALDVALRRTAAASTGAGLLMIAAAIPFATTGLLTVREFGVGVALAVDARRLPRAARAAARRRRAARAPRLVADPSASCAGTTDTRSQQSAPRCPHRARTAISSLHCPLQLRTGQTRRRAARPANASMEDDPMRSTQADHGAAPRRSESLTVTGLAYARARSSPRPPTSPSPRRRPASRPASRPSLLSSDPGRACSPRDLTTLTITFPTAKTKFNFKSRAIKQCKASDIEIKATLGSACSAKSQIGSGHRCRQRRTRDTRDPGERRGVRGQGPDHLPAHARRLLRTGAGPARQAVSANKVTTPEVPVINAGGLNVVITALNLTVKTIGHGSNAFVTAGKCSWRQVQREAPCTSSTRPPPRLTLTELVGKCSK
jgi:RND superfamily putative drug exporter